jgi:predicted DNA-binding transcriptional regulator YafY
MDDQAKFQRMLEILMKLSGSYGYSIKQLASDFNSSERTIYRYLTTFKNAGFLIENHNGYFKIDKKSPDYKDLSKLIHFSEEEAHILSRAIHLIDDENKFKNELYEKLYILFDSDKAVNQIVKKESSENVIKLKGAIKNKEIVILKGYRSSNSDNIRDRSIEPFNFTSNYNYVWGYDAETKSSKTFKIARIKEVIITNKKWSYQKKHKQNEVDVFRISGTKTVKVILSLNLMAYNLLIEEYPLSEKYITKKTDKYIFDGSVCDFSGIGRFVLGMMDQIEVIKPNGFKDFLNDKIKKKRF